ncbi:hypothetical protein F53441_8311 [Fusarium austroafricanum]|uniref:Uncharacterized protein n=1 Tax=Fusarium austroafricanum TaxID=2364996 RepID=A0A8H4P4U2_9HYPO|nr:hypothetical protein F53441_8311 [Fusarium austroafricanum]
MESLYLSKSSDCLDDEQEQQRLKFIFGHSNTHMDHVITDVLGVMLEGPENKKMVKVRWEDTMEFYYGIKDKGRIKAIKDDGSAFVQVVWEDTWEPLDGFEDGYLKKKAEKMFQDFYRL